MAVTDNRIGEVLIVTADNPPVNALGHAVRQGIAQAIERAAADDGVRAIVIACAGSTFFAGADISEFGKPRSDPTLPALCNLIEASAKPVVAAIHGTALGGGAEIALACHGRVAAADARIGLPEVKLGLIPGAGGTQRLPRLVGTEEAIGIILSGDPVKADRALSIGLVDRIVARDELLEAATEQALALCGTGPSRLSTRPNPPEHGAIDRYRSANERKIRNLDAPQAALRAIRAATELDFADGARLERSLFEELEAGDQSAALRYFFQAERKAGRIDTTDAPLPIASVGVVGAGLMGSGIATAFLTAGLPVTLFELGQEALDRGAGTVRGNLERSVSGGRMAQADADAAAARLTPSLDLGALADCDLVVEAVFELMDIKRDLFAKLDAVVKPGAILATNTSYLDIDEIAAATGRPDHVLGLHFFSPAHIMKLLEVVRGAKTAPQVLATALAVAKRIRKTAVVAGNCYGFIGNRILARRRAEAWALLMEGATPEQIDDAHVGFGMPMGPFQMSDMAGVDIGWHRDPSRIENLRDALCAAGRLGQKTGKGFYDYDDKRNRSASPEARAIIEDHARSCGHSPRAVSADEILERTLYAMVDEGARIMADGIADRASDIDVAWVRGYGWPIWRGGPMHWGDRTGLAHIVARLDHHGRDVSPLLRSKAEAGTGFTD
jgi:3-hydroxyacyl-CoA dehydrogenase